MKYLSTDWSRNWRILILTCRACLARTILSPSMELDLSKIIINSYFWSSHRKLGFIKSDFIIAVLLSIFWNFFYSTKYLRSKNKMLRLTCFCCSCAKTHWWREHTAKILFTQFNDFSRLGLELLSTSRRGGHFCVFCIRKWTAMLYLPMDQCLFCCLISVKCLWVELCYL